MRKKHRQGSEQGGSSSDGGDRRRSGRIRCEGIDTPLGEIVDLSGSGLRVRSAKPLALREGDAIALKLIAGEDLSLSAPVRVVWTKRSGWRLYEAGLEFEALDAEQRGVLLQLVQYGAASLSILDQSRAA